MLSTLLKQLALGLALATPVLASELVMSEDLGDLPAAEWAATLGTDPAHLHDTFSTDGKLQVHLIEAKEASNILWPGEQPEYVVQLRNLTDAAIAVQGRLVVVPYETWTYDGEIFRYGVRRSGEASSSEQTIAVPAKGVQHLRVKPTIPERNGGYAVLLELPGQPFRFFITSVARTFQPVFEKRRFYRLTMDQPDAQILRRLGAAPNRIGMSPRGPNDPEAEKYYSWKASELRQYAEAGLPICIEFGHGTPWYSEMQPLGRPRPKLDDHDVMPGGYGDIVWSPAYDANFTAFVKRLLVEFGWPKGPVNAVKIWNEPWNGGSIAGWAADDERFRELTIAMDKGVRAAHEEAGVEVLQGGADSSSNSLDKYFSDGSERFAPMFDFLSIHYQGVDPHTNWRAWRERKGADGKPNPVLFWDTESWVGNTDDRVASVLSTMFSFGQDRAVGIQSNRTMVTGGEHRILQADGTPVIDSANGRPLEKRVNHASGVAAAVGAFQHLVGEGRAFSRLLWRGLPFVMQFDGQIRGGARDPEDGTLVVLGDMGFYGADSVAFRTVRSLAEGAGKRALRAELAKLPADAPERTKIEERLRTPWPYTGCTMKLKRDGTRFDLYDFYGNPVPAMDGIITIPLGVRGYYLRGDGKDGSFAALLKAVEEAQIDGYEPIERKCHDFTAPIASRPTMRLDLRNILNRPVTGALAVSIQGLELDYPRQVTIPAHEQRTVEVKVTGGQANAANLYPLDLRFDAGGGLLVEHHEDMRVNWISRRTITVDGKLDDWKDAIPQQIRIEEAAKATITEKAWKPYETFDEGIKKGFALGYLAWDEQNFYFATKIADTSRHPGTLRFATRDDDAYFYPEISYLKPDPRQAQQGAENFSARWTGFLQARSTGKHTLILNTDDGVRLWVDGKQVIDDWISRPPADSKAEVELTAGKRVPIRIEYYQGGGGASTRFDWIQPGAERQLVPSEALSTTADGAVPGLAAEYFNNTRVDGKPLLSRVDARIDFPGWTKLPWTQDKPKVDGREGYEQLVWPTGVRRYSYRKEPVLPCGNGHANFDNVQIAFNVLPEERKKKISALPGLFQDYMAYSCTDYEWALNPVAEAYGGGTEVWRLRRPDMPHKHFYPRSLKSPADGPAPGAQLAIVYEGGWRIVEAAIPWSEVPEAKARLDAGQTVKFSFRVNDDQGVGCMELSKRRSVAKRNGSFFADWTEHWANELEFGAEPKGK